MWSYHYKNGSGTWSNIIFWSPYSFRGGVDRDTDCLDMWGCSKTRILPPFLCKLANKSQFYGSILRLYTTLANKSYFLLLLLQLLVSCLIIIVRNNKWSSIVCIVVRDFKLVYPFPANHPVLLAFDT